jgi:hypothetical protein
MLTYRFPLSRLLLTLVAALALTIATAGSAIAGGEPQCVKVDPLTGKCVITIPVDSGTGAVSVDNPHSRGGAPACLRFGAPRPCQDPAFGTWSNALQCYLKRTDPPPPPTSPLWGGHYPDGAIYDCVDPIVRGTGGGEFWLPGPPPGAALTPAQAAGLVVRRMVLRAAEIGIVPADKPGSIGAVGAPVYMWTTPGPTTFGPQVLTSSAGGTSITATAKVDRIVWTMGDGASVVCRTPGTPYEDRYGFDSSPDCGYRYTRTSAGRPGNAYPITATSYWLIDWSGPGGSAGQIPLTLNSNTSIVVGELQALTTR